MPTTATTTVYTHEKRKTTLADLRKIVELTDGWDEDTEVTIVLGSWTNEAGDIGGQEFKITVTRTGAELPKRPSTPRIKVGDGWMPAIQPLPHTYPYVTCGTAEARSATIFNDIRHPVTARFAEGGVIEGPIPASDSVPVDRG